jgi:hypothetical protein
MSSRRLRDACTNAPHDLQRNQSGQAACDVRIAGAATHTASAFPDAPMRRRLLVATARLQSMATGAANGARPIAAIGQRSGGSAARSPFRKIARPDIAPFQRIARLHCSAQSHRRCALWHKKSRRPHGRRLNRNWSLIRRRRRAPSASDGDAGRSRPCRNRRASSPRWTVQAAREPPSRNGRRQSRSPLGCRR